MMDQLPITDQSIPIKDSYVNDATPIVDANVRLHGFADDKIVVDSASKETEPSQDTTGMEQEPESTPSSPEKSPESPSDHLVIADTDQPMEEQSTEPTESKEPPSYDEIKQAIANEMAKKDDFLGDFGADIDLGDEDGDVDEHWDLNEDDLLMELDEMINQ
ncbi:hypothetical protein OS493_025124 [Desmophyllum pertusum]|uniref:Uncharacterized protein n=1 Tax=Desmophyllum pertusum TaxID=174260 RepID=A0A9W9ZZM5_9CNID|nr:hypothetical protein OS493_025124 [Desmophyllum pertusum]